MRPLKKAPGRDVRNAAMRRLFAGLLLAAGLLIPATGRDAAVPDLAFIPYPKYGGLDVKPASAVLRTDAGEQETSS
jgi:hypothetical protein